MSDKNTLGPNGYLPETNAANVGRRRAFRDICGKCGARRIDQQIGLEETPDAWCARLVEVFREVRRVLRSDGVCWVNIGDSYTRQIYRRAGGSLKPKDLIGQPWMLAFALRADGWWLRSEIIWAKPSPMPESGTDRPTKAHEQVFMFTKSARYFYDAEAVKEPTSAPTGGRARAAMNGDAPYVGAIGGEYHEGRPGRFSDYQPLTRNLRSVWTIATDPLPSIEVDGEKLDHFASFPKSLAATCIRAGTSQRGCCPACGAPWARVVEREFEPQGGVRGHNGQGVPRGITRSATTNWRPTCSCPTAKPIPCRVLDCFGGSGRTALAAEELGRDCTLIELNPKSVAMARAQLERAKARRMIGRDVTGNEKPAAGQLTLF